MYTHRRLCELCVYGVAECQPVQLYLAIIFRFTGIVHPDDQHGVSAECNRREVGCLLGRWTDAVLNIGCALDREVFGLRRGAPEKQYMWAITFALLLLFIDL